MSSLSGKQGPRYRHIAGEAEPYETIGVDKLTPIIGAEISGVDLGEARRCSNRQMDEIHRALAENLVIFFRDQHITPAAASRLRPQVRRAAHPSGGAARARRSRADEDLCRQGFSRAPMARAGTPTCPATSSRRWASILYIKQCPPRGGDTLFANMYAAYEALSDRMKAYLDGLTALHDGEQIYRGLYANYGVADKPAYPRAEHPVVRTHPVTGKKALYVNRGFTRHIIGIPRDESDAILRLSLRARGEPAVPVPLPLAAENSIAFWDNRCAQHRAMWDYWPHTRSGTRRDGEGRAAGVSLQSCPETRDRKSVVTAHRGPRMPSRTTGTLASAARASCPCVRDT